MSLKHEERNDSTVQALASVNYRPAVAAELLDREEFDRAIECCREIIDCGSSLLSVQIIYGRALFHTGQMEAAEQKFFTVLKQDPENQVALKYLADIKWQGGEQFAALVGYRRILELDPDCRGLCSNLPREKKPSLETITLKRRPESAQLQNTAAFDNHTQTSNGQDHLDTNAARRDSIPFYTETVGDLYLQQGHPRLAAKVFQFLQKDEDSPRLRQKLDRARKKIQDRE